MQTEKVNCEKWKKNLKNFGGFLRNMESKQDLGTNLKTQYLVSDI